MYEPIKPNRKKEARKAIIILLCTLGPIAAVILSFIGYAHWQGERLSRQRAAEVDDRRRAGILSDIDYMMEVLEAVFPYFDLIYRQEGVDLRAVAQEMRERVECRLNPMDVFIFTRMLNDYFFGVSPNVRLERANLFLAPDCIGNSIFFDVIEEGRIGHLQVVGMPATIRCEACTAIMHDVSRQLIGFEHLIIDIRGARGDWGHRHFDQFVIRYLTPQLEIWDRSVHFIKANEVSDSFRNWHPLSTGPRLHITSFQSRLRRPVTLERINNLFDIENLPDGVLEDLLQMDYYFVVNYTSDVYWLGHHIIDGEFRRFDGKVWMLIDETMGQGARDAAQLYRDAGIATFVGDAIPGPLRIPRNFSVSYLKLPYSRIRISFDHAYTVDIHGRPFIDGIVPHYLNRPGMDALETVLAMIEEGLY